MPDAPQQHRPHGPQRPRDNRRHSAAERGYDWGWTTDKPHILRQMTTVDEIDLFCRYCRIAKATMLDHAIPPLRKGPVGSMIYKRYFNDKRLLVPCCVRCNSQKGQLLPHELKARYPVMYERLLAALEKRSVSLLKMERGLE